jgi:hypothetical protein
MTFSHTRIFVNIHLFTADVEAEDIDLGTADHGSLASDVDGDLPEDNPDALDSDDEGDLNRELGIDLEESDGVFLPMQRELNRALRPDSSDACRTLILSLVQ